MLLNLKNHKSIWSIEIFFQKAHYDIDVYRYRYRIGIGRYEKILSVIYRIGRFEKWDLSVLIGISRYEKKLIGRTLTGCILEEELAPSFWFVRRN